MIRSRRSSPFPMGGSSRAGSPMRGEPGAVLFEVLVALTILGVAGLSIASVVGEQARALADLRGREEELARAERVIARLSLQDRHGLDIRLGRRVDGGFVTDVQ